tara:strand:+ start:30583 stop:31479 length:897 start_codon:yes stop_codon:yes gene_type:complete
MKNYYAISIPKPCHENWNEMTPKEKGRFCDSCSKTVIDFTKMNTYEIQDFINENKNNRICGHFKQTQLDSINLRIPPQVLMQRQSFHRIFLLALLIAMGTSLMNCTNKHGDKQKIDSIEVLKDTKNEQIDVTFGKPVLNKIDSIPDKNCTNNKTDSEEITITGDIIEVVGFIVPEKNTNTPIPFPIVETPPEFKNTPANLSTEEKRDYFQKEVQKLIEENFDVGQGNLTLSGKQKIQVQFKIDSLGFVNDIKTRAPHPKLETEAKRVVQILPQFIPAKQTSKSIAVVYTLPIVFQVEE